MIRQKQIDFVYDVIKKTKSLLSDEAMRILAKQTSVKSFYSPRTLRLTMVGLNKYGHQTKHYNIDPPIPQKIKTEHIVYLARYMIGPFYVDSHRIVVFTPEDAFDLKILNGDLNEYVELKREGEDAYGREDDLSDEDLGF